MLQEVLRMVRDGGPDTAYYPGIADINNIRGIISGSNENESFISYKFIGIRTIYKIG